MEIQLRPTTIAGVALLPWLCLIVVIGCNFLSSATEQAAVRDEAE